MSSYALFSARSGWCGIAWSGGLICRLRLPESDPVAARNAVLEGSAVAFAEAEPTEEIADIISRVQQLFSVGAADFSNVRLNFRGVPPFFRKVYECVREIPPGETMNYGEVAIAVGCPGGARAVGQAMGRNPFPPIVPCHRVWAAGGKAGGFTAPGGVKLKRELLWIEQQRGMGGLAAVRT